MTIKIIDLPNLSVEEKWHKAESNLIYFVVSGITFAMNHGSTPEEFGIWAGKIANPYWEEDRGKGPSALVYGIAYNKQQFRNFELEIINASETKIEARMRGFGEDTVRDRREHEITPDDYIRFFGKKWEVIADYLNLIYQQESKEGWVFFSVEKK